MNEANIFRMLTVDEAADMLAVSERHVRALIDQGVVPSWRPSPAVVRVPYWVVIWKVGQNTGMSLEEVIKLDTIPVTMLLDDSE